MAVPATVDPDEIARFNRLAADWWDEDGKLRPLHRMNPARLAFIKDIVCRRFGRDAAGIRAFTGLQMLDIGCGGGILAEPLARLGAEMVGADAAEEAVAAAQAHAAAGGLAIDYRATTAEALASSGERFDVVLAMEIVEHVPDFAAFLATCAGLVRPGGLLFVATLNRTLRSFALAIVGAEYVLRWVPRGSHQWSKFVRPEEIAAAFRAAGLKAAGETGIVYNPIADDWRRSPDMAVNFIMAAGRAA